MRITFEELEITRKVVRYWRNNDHAVSGISFENWIRQEFNKYDEYKCIKTTHINGIPFYKDDIYGGVYLLTKHIEPSKFPLNFKKIDP